ncbi:Ldh family oxidoreductase [Haloplanus litoreus]|uniref:Ldh family oxidoreductase n=1 Tax=Haloplanus litoreus TaxID=767515 RepID=UPI0036202A10
MARFDAAELRAGAASILDGLGTPPAVAEEVAASLVRADLRGHESHGVVAATAYGSMVDAGAIDPAATATVASRDGATVTVDGRRAFGQHTGRVAVDAGATAAAAHGVAVVGVRNGTHLGRIGEWAERAADRGLAFVAFVNSGVSTPTVTVPGSADRTLSTNPIAVGLPTFDARPFPVVLDMATSQVAHGKVTRRHVDGTTMPEEWTTTADGEGVTDATAFEEEQGHSCRWAA